MILRLPIAFPAPVLWIAPRPAPKWHEHLSGMAAKIIAAGRWPRTPVGDRTKNVPRSGSYVSKLFVPNSFLLLLVRHLLLLAWHLLLLASCYYS